MLAEVVNVMLEGEMVWHDQMKSVGREVKVVVSGMGLSSRGVGAGGVIAPPPPTFLLLPTPLSSVMNRKTSSSLLKL